MQFAAVHVLTRRRTTCVNNDWRTSISVIFLSEAPAGDDSDGGEEDMARVLMLAY